MITFIAIMSAMNFVLMILLISGVGDLKMKYEKIVSLLKLFDSKSIENAFKDL